MSINLIYNKLYSGETVRLSCTKSAYETIRTNLINKYKNTANMLSDMGDDSLLGNYVQASYNSTEEIATLVIKPVTEKKRKQVSYKFL